MAKTYTLTVCPSSDRVRNLHGDVVTFTRYPRTTGYTVIAALQLTAFFAAMLNNRLDPAHI